LFKTNKIIEVKFDELVYEDYLLLQNLVLKHEKTTKKPTYQQLLDSINKAIEDLSQNPFFGDLIPKKYLNKKLIRYYGTDKIFRIELVGFWRMLYAIVGDEAKIIALILDYMNHNDYNKKFNYKKK
jgi:aromatic ring-opening dioxygenase LigB subunit